MVSALHKPQNKMDLTRVDPKTIKSRHFRRKLYLSSWQSDRCIDLLSSNSVKIFSLLIPKRGIAEKIRHVKAKLLHFLLLKTVPSMR
jgi:hypothetical protein